MTPLPPPSAGDAESQRLRDERERRGNWKRWGPYLSERQWGTVREDYSPDGSGWDHFPHDHARRRAYRWGEDGLQGWTDRQCRLCFAPALWNGKDPILKERLFGLNGHEGNHGEDVKEVYFYLESTPTHSYTKALYKYPQGEFPYAKLAAENGRRGRDQPEYELTDTGALDDGRYFDVVQEVAKRSPEDLVWKISATNRGLHPATLHVLPTLWFRNVWKWGSYRDKLATKPSIAFDPASGSATATHETLGTFKFYADSPGARNGADWLFTENETDYETVFGITGPTPYTKDAFHRYVTGGATGAVNPKRRGTKAAPHFVLTIQPGATATVRCRLHRDTEDNGLEGLDGFDDTIDCRRAECDAFYRHAIPGGITRDEELVCRQGYAGLLWTKQFYYYVVHDWLRGDGDGPAPPESRLSGRNADWDHLFARDILSMPDKWEYPWFAAWDTAFHMVPFAKVDPDFAKSQLLLLLREWYMHPNGQLPAYEWNFSDVNPPVHAWAVWRVYKIADPKGSRDLSFLERAFQKLLLNFTWWVNRKDTEGRHVFGGGFLGLDNIGVFDRSQPLPDGGHLHQADGTAWMAFYCLTMLAMALELATERPAYEDIASKFFEHFVNITDAINSLGGTGLWDEQDGFYYDRLIIDHDNPIPLRIRSLVGLLPLCAAAVLREDTLDALPGFKKRFEWFLANHPRLARYIRHNAKPTGGGRGRYLLALPTKRRLRRCLDRLLDPGEFLSDFGVRSLSKAHAEHPFVFEHGGERNVVRYSPGESPTGMFGGNSNWRGPVWFPVNYLIVEALERYHYFYGHRFTVPDPRKPSSPITLGEASRIIADRLISIFLPGPAGRRPCYGDDPRFTELPHWKDLILFHEFFHGESGNGLGASHQTGWTALVVRLVRERAENPD